MADVPGQRPRLDEYHANLPMRAGRSMTAHTPFTPVYLQVHPEPGADDILVAVVNDGDLAAELVARWNAPLRAPGSAAEYRGHFAAGA